MNLTDIKLIIWDLDETFWKGTISEESVTLFDENIHFLKNTTDMGIVNSICSKNDEAVVRKFLENIGVWELFVFPSVDWTPKGYRVKTIIEEMKLRAVNVLFIDDNIQNLEEAKAFCPGLLTASPDEISELISQAEKAEKSDKDNKRLNQYKLLESKMQARNDFGSNEEFLSSCAIEVDIFYDCATETERIYELLMRSNQLNYTKFRQDKTDFEKLIADPSIRSGYVKVSDKFGDYGIVGFFAVKNNRLIHFAFSCRTLGMKVEQYVYFLLGCPELDVSGDVVSPLNKTENPHWINNNCNSADKSSLVSENMSKKILFKGPCDMSQMYAFLNLGEYAVTEFAYVNDKGIYIEGHNHTSQIVTAMTATAEQKHTLLSESDFWDVGAFETSMGKDKYDFIVLSMLTDGNLGIYRNKNTGCEIALCEKYYDITDPKNQDDYLSGKIFTSKIDFTKELLCDFSEKYCFEDNSDAHKTIQNLDKIRSLLDKNTVLVLLLGSEREFKKKCEVSYAGRHLQHIVMNRAIEEWATGKANVVLIPFDRYIKGEGDFIDTINHFVKRVYYDLACDLVKLFGTVDGNDISVKSKSFLIKSTVRQKLKFFKSKLRKLLKTI